jgi:hypothetical protein
MPANAFLQAQAVKQAQQYRNALLGMDQQRLSMDQQKFQADQEDDEEDRALYAAWAAGDWATADAIDPVSTMGYRMKQEELKKLQNPQAAETAGFGNVNPGDFTPESLAKYAQTKNFSDLQRYVTPAQDKVVVIGGVPSMVDPRSHEVTSLSTLPGEIAGKTAIAGATAQGRVTGTQTAEAAMSLPSAENNAADAKGVLDQLVSHKGTRFLYGGYGYAPIVPGTPQADANGLLEQVRGKAFLEAFQSLKGGGAITQVEGEKATAAITRLQDRRISYPAALAAAKELKGIMDKGLKAQRVKAGQGGTQRLKFDQNGDPVQ